MKPIVLSCCLALMLTGCGREPKATETKTADAMEVTDTNEVKRLPEMNAPGIGEAVPAGAITVLINGARIAAEVSTQNEGINLPKEDGYWYVMLDLTFRNTGQGPGTAPATEVVVDNNGTESRFPEFKIAPAKGYGPVTGVVPPGTSRNTRLVYKLPQKLKGTLYLQPVGAGARTKVTTL